MAPKRKITRSTNAQIKLLVNYMASKPKFAAREMTGPDGPKLMEEEWAKLKDLLADKGPDKSIDQWKHTWRDLKKKARQEEGQAILAWKKTGNSTSELAVSEKTKKILDTIKNELDVEVTDPDDDSSTHNIEVVSHFEIPVSPSSVQCYDWPSPQPPSSPPAVRPPEPPEPPAEPPLKHPVSPALEPPSPKANSRRKRTPTSTASALFLAAQRKTNKILKELSMELKISNQLRREQVALLRHMKTSLRRISCKPCSAIPRHISESFK